MTIVVIGALRVKKYNCCTNFYGTHIHINQFMPGGFFCLNSLDRSISNKRSARLVFNITIFIQIHVSFANSADPDQMAHFDASDLGPLCYQCSFYWTLDINRLKS